MTIDPNDIAGYGGYIYCPDLETSMYYKWEIFIDAGLIYYEEGLITTYP